eukprot:1153986-Pelagomonas_calceolata.AAC.3
MAQGGKGGREKSHDPSGGPTQNPPSQKWPSKFAFINVTNARLTRIDATEVEDRAVLGYGPELQTTAFELVASKNPRTPIDKGEGYVQMAVSTKVGWLTKERAMCRWQ